MTQSPIEPRHTEAAKLKWINPGDEEAYANRFAQTLANDEAKGKALAEIHAKLVAARADGLSGSVGAVAGLYAAIDIAAPYRAPASDPVAEALKDVLIALGVGPDECVASKWNAGVAKFRTFIEGGAHDEH